MPAQERVEARRLARRAIELDKDDPSVLARAGHALAFVVGEVEEGAALALAGDKSRPKSGYRAILERVGPPLSR